LWCKVPPGSQGVLIGADPQRFFVPPYFGPKGWVGVVLDASVDWNEVAALVTRSYRLIAPKRRKGSGSDLACCEQRADLRLVLDSPEDMQETVEAIGTHVLLPQQTELLLHLAVGHRILEVSTVIRDAHCLARTGLQDDLELAQIGELGCVG